MTKKFAIGRADVRQFMTHAEIQQHAERARPKKQRSAEMIGATGDEKSRLVTRITSRLSGAKTQLQVFVYDSRANLTLAIFLCVRVRG